MKFWVSAKSPITGWGKIQQRGGGSRTGWGGVKWAKNVEVSWKKVCGRGGKIEWKNGAGNIG